MPKCLECGNDLVWGADFDYEDYGEDSDGIVHTYSCPNCGAYIEVYVPNEKEQ